VQKFKAAKEYLGALRADQLASLLTASGDIVLFVSEDGILREFAVPDERLAQELGASKRWVGKSWSKLLTSESIPKLEVLLKEARTEASIPRALNHVTSCGDIAIVYTVLRVGIGDTLLALGRDMRAVANLQQQLVAAQMNIDREYEKLRAAQLRYKFLFELMPDAVMIVEGPNYDIKDANSAARKKMGEAVKRGLLQGFSKDGAQAVRALLSQARASGRPEVAEARLIGQGGRATVTATHIRQQGGAFYLVRVSTSGARQTDTDSELSPAQTAMLAFVDRSPDGFVVTSEDGRIRFANASFIEMVQVGSEDHIKGETLDRWIGRSGVDVGVLLRHMQESGCVRQFATTLKPEFGDAADIELSGVSLMDTDGPSYGLTLRLVRQRVQTPPQHHRSPEEIKQLIGRMSLKDLVRETADVIERMSIEAALELTKDNRASAADLLGLSRQSLYIKLRRYGLDNDPADNAG
jgi:transcriptional regulator PpsR